MVVERPPPVLHQQDEILILGDTSLVLVGSRKCICVAENVL